MTERAGIYARSATDNPDSIDNQRAACAGYVRAHEYQVVAEYADNGVGGNSSPSERPGLGAAWRDPAWDVLVVHDINRVMRGAHGILQLEEWLTANGKVVETVGGLRFPMNESDRSIWPKDEMRWTP